MAEIATEKTPEKQPYKKGGGRNCAVVGCSNNQRKLAVWRNAECDIHAGKTHGNCLCLEPFKLFFFPKLIEKRNNWILALNRKGYNPGMSAVVCSDHFVDGRPTQANPYPSINMGFDNNPEGRACYRKLRQGCITSSEPVVYEHKRPSPSMVPKLGNRLFMKDHTESAYGMDFSSSDVLNSLLQSHLNTTERQDDNWMYGSGFTAGDNTPRGESFIKSEQREESVKQERDETLNQSEQREESFNQSEQRDETFNQPANSEYNERDQNMTSGASGSNNMDGFQIRPREENIPYFNKEPTKSINEVVFPGSQFNTAETSYAEIPKSESRRKRPRKMVSMMRAKQAYTNIKDFSDDQFMSPGEIKEEPTDEWTDQNMETSFDGSQFVGYDNHSQSPDQSDHTNRNVQQESRSPEESENIFNRTPAESDNSTKRGTVVVDLENMDVPNDSTPAKKQNMKRSREEDEPMNKRLRDSADDDMQRSRRMHTDNCNSGAIPISLARAMTASPGESFGTISDINLEEASFTVSSKCGCCNEMIQVKVTDFRNLLKLFIKPEFLEESNLF